MMILTKYLLYCCRELFSPWFAVRTFANDGSEVIKEVRMFYSTNCLLLQSLLTNEHGIKGTKTVFKRLILECHTFCSRKSCLTETFMWIYRCGGFWTILRSKKQFRPEMAFISVS